MNIQAMFCAHRYTYNRNYPFLCIDGEPLNIWAAHAMHEEEVINLCTAQHSCWDIHENAYTLIATQPASFITHVPILICPDELDFDYFIVVEQKMDNDTIMWSRIGHGGLWTPEAVCEALEISSHSAALLPVEWVADIDVRFSKQEFLKALADLKHLFEVRSTQAGLQIDPAQFF